MFVMVFQRRADGPNRTGIEQYPGGRRPHSTHSNADSRTGRTHMSESQTASNTEQASAEPTEDVSGDEPTPEDVRELRDSIEEQYSELEERYDEIRNLLDDYNRTAMEFIREHPGICLAGALGTGYVVGRLASKRWLA